MLNRDSFLTYKEFILMMMSFSLLDFSAQLNDLKERERA